MKAIEAAAVFRLTAVGALAAVASILLDLTDFPAAWLTGGLIGASLAVMFGIRFVLPNSLVNVSYVLLGALFGSAMRPSVIDQALLWGGSLLLCCLSLAIIMYASTWYMQRIEKWDRGTSFFATAPGALPAVVALASEFNVDQKRIVLSQTVRLFSLMAFVPLVFSSPGANPAIVTEIAALDLPGLAVVMIVATSGGLVLRALRLPGSLIIGALLATGILYAMDGVEGSLPIWLQNAAMMVIGMLIGAQIARISVANLMGSMRAVLVALAIGVAISAAFAVLASNITGLPFVQVLLAYLPGAMEGLTVLGFVLGMDPAFISVHHIVRFIFVVLSLPVVTRYWRDRTN